MLTSFAAQAAPVIADQIYGVGFEGTGSALRGIEGTGFAAPTNPDGAPSPAAPWTFTLSSGGTLTFLDLFLSTDQFAIFNFGTALGVTSPPNAGGTCGSDVTCALSDDRYSRAVFNLAPGSYSITGTQLLGESGAGAFYVTSAPDVSAVPVPAAGMLLGLGLVGLAALRRRDPSA